MSARLVSLVPTGEPGVYQATIEVGGKLLTTRVREKRRECGHEFTFGDGELVSVAVDNVVPVGGLEWPEKP